jgi:hypothetical protein
MTPSRLLFQVAVPLVLGGIWFEVMRRVARAARRQPSTEIAGRLVLRRTSFETRTGVISASVLFAMAVGGFIWALPYWQFGMFAVVVVALIVIPGLLDLRRWVAADDSGLYLHSPWVGSRSMLWTQVQAVTFGNFCGPHLRFTSTAAKPIRVEGFYAGITELEALVSRQLSPAVLGSALDDYHTAMPPPSNNRWRGP